MNTKTVYQLDEYGYFLEEVEADESVRDPGFYLIPGGCIEHAPPESVDGKVRRWVNGEWVQEKIPATPQAPAPEPLTFLEAKAAKLKEINDRCSLELKMVKFGYPDEEVESWSKQETEARAYMAVNTVATPFLTALAAARQVPFDLLVAKVVEKADLFATITGTIIGKRQRCEDLISPLQEPEATIADIDAVAWPV
jgi:hypothetical protein